MVTHVLLGAILGLLPTIILFPLMMSLQRSHQKEQEKWAKERESLLNRCMTKEWNSYQMMQVPAQSFALTSEQYIPGMSDEEELKRVGVAPFADYRGVGEIYAEMESDQVELGLRPE